ncbi:hypothetical protein AVEN_117388-1 [Araneus ventricosus]|uniref:CUB domain-containing protein n=1 Tax=Araneus ventricosus TaxID=182803 RepID=A0A4Y2E6H8_ARAVE|nr:hypothetical protein AVEN_117388-1 [Araneus ventricosus]
MEWPARSPNLNYIEHVWDMLGRRIVCHSVPQGTLLELQQALLHEWALLPQLAINDTIASVPRLCEACISARGYHSRYERVVRIADSAYQFGLSRRDGRNICVLFLFALLFDMWSTNCAEAELTLYDGYSSISFNPKVLQKYCGDLRYYKNVEEQTQLSSRNRLLLRFKTSAAQVMKGEDLDKNAVGFKIVWTAVDFKKEGQCQEFICKESRYCFSSPENSCAEMKNYCIDKSLVCNGHPNCGNEDYTDEDKCNIPLLAGCGAAGGVLLLSFLIGFCLYRRHGSLRNSPSQSLNMQLRQLEHSPSFSGRPPNSNFYYPGDPNCSVHAASYELLHTKPMAR